MKINKCTKIEIRFNEDEKQKVLRKINRLLEIGYEIEEGWITNNDIYAGESPDVEHEKSITLFIYK